MSQADVVEAYWPWRLVCDNCGFKLPRNAACNPHTLNCCEKTDLHLHDLMKPCQLCADDDEPITRLEETKPK